MACRFKISLCVSAMISSMGFATSFAAPQGAPAHAAAPQAPPAQAAAPHAAPAEAPERSAQRSAAPTPAAPTPAAPAPTAAAPAAPVAPAATAQPQPSRPVERTPNNSPTNPNPNPNPTNTNSTPTNTSPRPANSRNDSATDGEHRDGARHNVANQDASRNGNFYYPFGYYPFAYSSNYFDPNWNSDNSYNQANRNGQFRQQDEAITEPNSQVPPVTPTPTVLPETSSPALNSALSASPQWREADEQVRIAQSEYDSASAQVKAQLRTQPSYQQALSLKESDSQRIESLKTKDPAPTIERAAPAAVAKLDAAQSVTQMENAALLADPRASAAKAKLDAAIVHRDEMRHAVEASLPTPARAPAR